MLKHATIGTAIGEVITNNAHLIASYAVITTLVIIVIIIRSRNSSSKYMKWKEEKINILGIYIRTYRDNEDAIFQQLFEENQRLEGENKSLMKTLKEQDLFKRLAILMIALGVFVGIYIQLKKKDK